MSYLLSYNEAYKWKEVIILQRVENVLVDILRQYSAYVAFLAVILMIFIKSKNKADLIIRFITTFLLCLVADQASWWTASSMYLRLLLWILFIISIIVSATYLKKLDDKLRIKNRIVAAICIGLSIILSYFAISCIRGHIYSETPVELAFPLKNGVYTFPNAGNGDSPILNYHYKMGFYVPPPGNGITAKYAVDFRKLSWLGSEMKGMTLSNNLNEYIFYKEPIYSPCDGEVIRVVNNQPDRTNSPTGGNTIIIKCVDQKMPFPYVIMLAHIEQGSIQVRCFDKVKKGQMIARAGASGTPSPLNPPALHIQANVLDPKGVYGIFGKSLPMKFDGHFPTKNDIIIN